MGHAETIQEAIEKGFKDISYALNNFSYKEQAEAFFNVLSREHRTLQQNFWKCIVDVMRKYGEQKYFDNRNDQSVKFCKATSAWLEENGLHYFPTI